MRSRIYLALLTALLACAGVAAAQSSDVTFRVPLNLTELSPDITMIKIRCSIHSPGRPAFAGFSDLNISGGQIVTMVTVVVPVSIPIDAGGSSAEYGCVLTGMQSSGYWGLFAANNVNPAFRLSPTPATLTGNFTW